MLIRNGMRPSLRHAAIRGVATHARSTLKVALLPADGIGREVIPVRILHSLDSPTILDACSCSTDIRPLFGYLIGCQGCIGSSGFGFTQARIR